MSSATSRAVLISGSSSGVGHATALHLAGRGWIVYAGARRPEGLAELEAAGCRPVRLDVTDETSMRDAVARVEREAGAVGVLVNNAGYSQSGAIESVSLDLVRRQFETNVFGLARMTQLVLPGMRRQAWGKIVNVSSIGGRLTFPGGGYYHASKFAVEGFTDVLRFEVQGFGIDAIVIEPGLIRTNFGRTAATAVEAAANAGARDDYSVFNAAVAHATRETYEAGLLGRLAVDPASAARVIERAISAKRPRTRYRVGPSALLLLNLRRLLPDRAWDAFLGMQFPHPA